MGEESISCEVSRGGTEAPSKERLEPGLGSEFPPHPRRSPGATLGVSTF